LRTRGHGHESLSILSVQRRRTPLPPWDLISDTAVTPSVGTAVTWLLLSNQQQRSQYTVVRNLVITLEYCHQKTKDCQRILISNLGAVRHDAIYPRRSSTIARPPRTQYIHISHFNNVGQFEAELLTFQQIFPIFKEQYFNAYISALCGNIYTKWRQIIIIGQSSTLLVHDFRIQLCCFISKPELVRDDCGRKSRPNFGLLRPSIKIRGEMAKCLSGLNKFNLGPGAAARFGRLNVWQSNG